MGHNILKDILNKQDFYSINDYDYLYLKDNDFYNEKSTDDRVWESYVKDINGGDNFADYCQYIFKVLEEEEYFDN